MKARRVRVVFQLFHPDLRREELGIENDAELFFSRPVLRGRKGKLAIIDPFPRARHWRIEANMLEVGFFRSSSRAADSLNSIRSGGNFSSLSSGVTGIGATCAETVCGFGRL